MNPGIGSLALGAALVLSVPAFADTVNATWRQREQWMACMGAKTIAKAQAEQQHQRIVADANCECRKVERHGRALQECAVQLEVTAIEEAGRVAAGPTVRSETRTRH